MTAAIALTKTLTATATLGRISSAYPNGRQYKGAWGNPTRIVYPRPTSERNAGGTYDGGLNGEWDKWLAGVPWYPALGVMHGAFPYRITISDEMVDGVAADTGVQFAEYIEDHTETTPYLGFYHAGWSVASGSTKRIQFTITATDCLGTTDTYAVDMTLYAQDHASVLSHFRVVDTTAGTNGTGTWSSPINTISGADVNSNKTLLGTDWASTTHCPKTVIVLLKTGSTIAASGMLNPPSGLGGAAIALQNDYFPRTYIGVYGAVVTADALNGSTFNSTGANINDVLIKNIRIEGNTTDSRAAFYIKAGKRCHLHDSQVNDFLSGQNSSNQAPIYTSGVGDNNYDFTVLRLTCDNVYSTEVAGGNTWLVLSWIGMDTSLIDDVTLTNLTYTTNRPDGIMRIKHDSRDCEWRRINIVRNGADPNLGQSLRLGTGGGLGATANKHQRFLLRHCNIYTPGGSSFIVATGGAVDTEAHSVQCHFNSLKGQATVASETDAAVANERQFLGYKNVIENSASGFSLTDMIPVDGESSTTDGNVGGTTGILNTDGTPADSQYLGLVGHTVITV